jgi:hypothetical protein
MALESMVFGKVSKETRRWYEKEEKWFRVRRERLRAKG